MQMWLRRLAVVTGLGVLLALPLPVLAATYTVTITDSLFVPSYLKVGLGDTITFVNSTDATQSAKTALASGFNTGNIGSGASKSVTVNTAGTYTYTSAFNSTLSGTVVVGSSSATMTDEGTGGAASGSATKTAQPAQTQPQPVSGVYETLLLMVVGGVALFAFGVMSRQRRLFVPRSMIVDLPSIRAERQDHERSEP